MRHALTAAGLLFAAVPAWAQNAPSAYAAFAPTSMFVIAEHGTDAKVKKGVSLIDPVNQVNCLSAAGCSLMATSQMEIDGRARRGEIFVRICTLVDGLAIGPQCTKASLKTDDQVFEIDKGYNRSGPEANMQIAINISSGSHTVQTEVHTKSYDHDLPLYGTANWTINYTLYGH